MGKQGGRAPWRLEREAPGPGGRLPHPAGSRPARTMSSCLGHPSLCLLSDRVAWEGRHLPCPDSSVAQGSALKGRIALTVTVVASNGDRKKNLNPEPSDSAGVEVRGRRCLAHPAGSQALAQGRGQLVQSSGAPGTGSAAAPELRTQRRQVHRSPGATVPGAGRRLQLSEGPGLWGSGQWPSTR